LNVTQCCRCTSDLTGRKDGRRIQQADGQKEKTLSTPRLAHRLRMNALLRRADARQAHPLLRYEPAGGKPSGVPVVRLCVALVLAFGLLAVTAHLKQTPAAQQCGARSDEHTAK
jgi:hypothetical protein